MKHSAWRFVMHRRDFIVRRQPVTDKRDLGSQRDQGHRELALPHFCP